MASNVTQRRRQATTLASQVEVFRTWFLVADCGQCGPRARRMSDFPVDITMQLILRLRCPRMPQAARHGRDRQRGERASPARGERVGAWEPWVGPGRGTTCCPYAAAPRFAVSARGGEAGWTLVAFRSPAPRRAMNIRPRASTGEGFHRPALRPASRPDQPQTSRSLRPTSTRFGYAWRRAKRLRNG